MAVKSEVIKARIKAKFPNVNLSNERLDALADKLKNKPADDADADAVDVVISDFNEILSFEQIAKDDDKARNLKAKLDATKTPEQIKQELADAEAEKQRLADEKKAQDDAPEWAKKFMESNKETIDTLKQEIADLKAGKQTESKLQTATQLFEGSEVLKSLSPELKKSWIGRINPESETPLEDQVKGLETEYTSLVQTNADNTILAGAPPSGFSSTKPADGEIEDVIGSM